MAHCVRALGCVFEKPGCCTKTRKLLEIILPLRGRPLLWEWIYLSVMAAGSDYDHAKHGYRFPSYPVHLLKNVQDATNILQVGGCAKCYEHTYEEKKLLEQCAKMWLLSDVEGPNSISVYLLWRWPERNSLCNCAVPRNVRADALRQTAKSMGRTPYEVLKFLIKCINKATRPINTDTKREPWHLDLMAVYIELVVILLGEGEENGRRSKSLQRLYSSALVNVKGCAKVLMVMKKVLHELCASDAGVPEESRMKMEYTLWLGFEILSIVFEQTAGHSAIRQAIHAGLFDVLIQVSRSYPSLEESKSVVLKAFLTEHLPRTFIAQSMVKLVAASVQTIPELAHCLSKKNAEFPEDIKHYSLSNEWADMISLLTYTHDIGTKIRAQRKETFSDCWNVRVFIERVMVSICSLTAILLQNECKMSANGTSQILRKCAGCSFALYCTRECQRSDWRRHRLECSQFRAVNRTSDKTVFSKTRFRFRTLNSIRICFHSFHRIIKTGCGLFGPHGGKHRVRKHAPIRV